MTAQFYPQQIECVIPPYTPRPRLRLMLRRYSDPNDAAVAALPSEYRAAILRQIRELLTPQPRQKTEAAS